MVLHRKLRGHTAFEKKKKKHLLNVLFNHVLLCLWLLSFKHIKMHQKKFSAEPLLTNKSTWSNPWDFKLII